jgi:hypothetical protein
MMPRGTEKRTADSVKAACHNSSGTSFFILA